MSPKGALVSLRGRRSAGKGRFDPSEPLHMTTRHAARKTGASSINGSVEDDESRRDSLEDLRPTTSNSLGSQASAKGSRRISSGSANGASDVNFSFDSQPSHEKKSNRSGSKPFSSPVEQPNLQNSPSPSRKRKRSSPTSPNFPADLPAYGPNVITNPPEAVLDSMEDAVVVVPEEDLSDRETEGSSDEQAGDYLAATQSTEITPAATPVGSEPVSPVSDETNPTPVYPSKHKDIMMADVGQVADLDEAEDNDDQLADGDDVEDADDVEDEDDHGRPGTRKRLTGRRRADHPDPKVEATMRRQLQLKSAYRAIARALKPVLAEVAQKTEEELEAEPTSHEQAVEYEGSDQLPGVQKLLDEYLAKRKAQLDAQLKYNRKQLRERLEAERYVRQERSRQQVEDLRQHRVDLLLTTSLQIAREAQLRDGDLSYETEDEDGEVILRPKGSDYRFLRGGAMDSKYDSRSRLALESERALDDLQIRHDMHNALSQFLQREKEEEQSRAAAPFTVMDSTAREAANARREGVQNTVILADAAAEVDRIANIPVIPVIPNEEATGLQLLADLSSRPSINPAKPPEPPPSTPRRLGAPFMEFPRTDMPPPPPMPPPSGFDGHRHGIPQGSPETQQWVERSMERSMQPFVGFSPRQDAIAELHYREPPMLSPVSSTSRSVMFPPLAMRPPDSDIQSHHGSLTPRHRRNFSTDSFDRYGSLDRSDPSRPSTQGRDGTSREHYLRPLTVDAETRPPPFVGQRHEHEFSRNGPLSIARLAPDLEENHPPPPVAMPMGQPRLLPPESPVQAHPQMQPQTPSTRARSGSNVAIAQISSPSKSLRDIQAKLDASTEHPTVEATPLLPSISQSPARPAPKWELPSSEGAIDPRLQEVPPASEVVQSERTVQKELEKSEPVHAKPATMELPHDDLQLPESAPEKEVTPPEASQKEAIQEEASREEHSRDVSQELPPKKSRSRASSIGQSTDVSGSQDDSNMGDAADRRRPKHGSKDFGTGHKTNKSQRNGLSRKSFKEYRGTQKRFGGTVTPMGENNQGTMFRFRLNPTENSKTAQWPQGTPTGTPQSLHQQPESPAYAPLPPYNQQHPPHHFGPPPPPPGAYGHPPYPFDPNQHYFHHRNSLPGPGGPHPHPLHPQSPVFGPPQSGVPEGWHAGSPVPGAALPPHGTPGRQQPSPGAFNSQFGGPPIAPATPDPWNQGAAPPHRPAFAQRQLETGGSTRKRAQSDNRPGSKFIPFMGPKNKGA